MTAIPNRHLLVWLFTGIFKKIVGSQAEKGELKQSIDGMERFCKDVVEITSSQAKEINGLQKTNLELFAWVEEAKSRDIRSKNPR